MALHKPEHRTIKYWVLWPILAGSYALAFFPMMLFWKRCPEEATSGVRVKWPKGSLPRRWEDYIDDPIDWLKQKLFGIGRLP